MNIQHLRCTLLVLATALVVGAQAQLQVGGGSGGTTPPPTGGGGGTASANDQCQKVLLSSYGAKPNSGVPPQSDGTSLHFSYSYKYNTPLLKAKAEPGCCKDITYPTCVQEVTPIKLTLELQDKNTNAMNQSWDASLGVKGEWHLLDLEFGFDFTSGSSKTAETSVTAKLERDVMCGSRCLGYLIEQRTVYHEADFLSPSLGWVTRDAVKKNLIIELSSPMAANDTFDPCLWKVTVGPPCPPITKAAMCSPTE